MKFLITAGPTREALDPVRYLTNRSSGRMGYALAGAAKHDGHEVILVSGPTVLDVPDNVDFVNVESAQEMYDAVAAYVNDVDVVICCAAVADYRPVLFSKQKIKKDGDRITIELERSPDILASVRSVFGYNGLLVGFAAETDNVINYAREKLLKKQCDFIVANDISRADIGFDARMNEVTLVYPEQEVHLAKNTKERIAMQIIEHITLLKS